MPVNRKDKLLEKARRNPNNLRFKELCTLFERYGFVRRKTASGHVVYKRDGNPKMTIPIQDCNGKANRYQVKQFLDILATAGLISPEEGENE